ncbi:VOC family protein [Roseicella aquatilis]|uniref:Glyoxalase n=1 Tax=Roseicella aquatilis TaxID=2527868 RepID=A0A4R4DWF5_9PROT|nr:VOC family protein [Roseicella aquatilis]TCZ66871.1 glyoxalase [Roseicella aquatilis]
MPLLGLNHYTIRPADLERTRGFYEEVLGLRVGDRPPLGFPGYWLYVGDTPTVHLIGPRRDDGHPPQREAGPTGLLDHIAFSCTGLAEMQQRLRQRGIEYRERVLPRDRQTQIFLRDPDGIAVELNYPAEETPTGA